MGGLGFYSQNIRLNKCKAGKESLVSSCVGIVEAIIARTIEPWFSITLLFSWDFWSRKSNIFNKCQQKGIPSFIMHLRCQMLKLGKFLITSLKSQPYKVLWKASPIFMSIIKLCHHCKTWSCDEVKAEYVCLVQYA